MSAEALFESIRPRLERYLQRHFGSHAEGDDCIQEGLIKAWRALVLSRGEYPLRVAQHYAKMGALTYLRKVTRKRAVLFNSEQAAGSPGSDEANDEFETGFWGVTPDFAPRLISQLVAVDEVRKLIAQATPRERQVLRMYYWQQMTAKEIAARLGCTHATVFYYLGKCRRAPMNRGPITRCPMGHLYDGANTYVTPTGLKQCRECRRLRQAKVSKATKGELCH